MIEKGEGHNKCWYATVDKIFVHIWDKIDIQNVLISECMVIGDSCYDLCDWTKISYNFMPQNNFTFLLWFSLIIYNFFWIEIADRFAY